MAQSGVDVAGTTTIDLDGGNPPAAGTYIVCNVPASYAMTVRATYKTTVLRSHDVAVGVGSTTATVIRPGY